MTTGTEQKPTFSDSVRKSCIEWTNATWNPLVGCDIASPGCTNCYAMREAHRIEAMGMSPAYKGLTKIVNGKAVWTGKVGRATDASMRKPLGVRAGTVFFVNSMSDFFHPGMKAAWRDEAYEIMKATPRHTYQILTKRPEVAVEYLADRTRFADLPNVWIGASVERAREAWRIDALRIVPAALRFLSVEPLIAPLGPVDLSGIGWVITGGESGRGARRVELEWVREVRDACVAADVPFFHKQWGAWSSNPLVARDGLSVEEAARRDLDPDAKGGASLDGRLWRQMPNDLPLAPRRAARG